MVDQAANRPTTRPRAWTLGSRRAAVSAGLPLHPEFLRLPPPLIVIGMHGSGTSIISRILAELGVYMGTNLDAHAEAAEFYHLNEELLYRSGSGWSHPEPFLSDLRRGPAAATAALRLLGATYGRLRTRYLAGMTRRPTPAGHAWGWKDPRNSLTLPLWLRLFPHARVLHVRRDPELAAASIHRRALREAEPEPDAGAGAGFAARTLPLLLHPPAALRLMGRKAGWLPPYPATDPCLDPGYCRRLAETYVAACRANRDLGGGRLEIRYEHLLAQPEDAVRIVAAFSLGDVSEARIRAAASLVRRPESPGAVQLQRHGESTL